MFMGGVAKLTLSGRVSGNSILLEGDASAFEGHEVIVQLEDARPKPGTWEAVTAVCGLISSPAGFDAQLVSRDDIYE